jgi:hypothetical protein
MLTPSSASWPTNGGSSISFNVFTPRTQMEYAAGNIERGGMGAGAVQQSYGSSEREGRDSGCDLVRDAFGIGGPSMIQYLVTNHGAHSAWQRVRNGNIRHLRNNPSNLQ